ncbi:MAG: DNA-binding transcriptional regulator BaeR, partial [Pseudomonadota bacterium]
RDVGMGVGTAAWAGPGPVSPRGTAFDAGRPLARPVDGPPLQIDADCMTARLCGQLLELTPLEFRLLRALAAHPGRVWSRDQLLDKLHDDHRALSERTVDSHIKNLRRKLQGAGAGPDPIRSIYGVGYALELHGG